MLDNYDLNKNDLNKNDLESRVNGDYRIAMTGRTWAIIRDKFPVLLPRMLVKGAIFARMTSEQKQQLIQELQHIGYHVGEIKVFLLFVNFTQLVKKYTNQSYFVFSNVW